ncbi:hypothetical protein C2G38_2250961 [Gigaspora rosea]|uniref:Uncharacterized protein n=1 Tax=Gigaspora rosea TaxID=44941 RepID=A0A397UKW3_9GLOM|nr:hypothetical protein C2G38_2250961 [Gigaspora rosea]
MYGYDEPESDCWYRDSGQGYNLIWQWVTLYVWIYASILYCMFVVIMVIRKLRYMKKEVDDVLRAFQTSQLTSYPTIFNKTLIFFVVRKVMWYPVTPLIAQFFGSFVETYAYVNRVIPYPLLLLCCIGVSLQGLLNSLVFFQDIAVTRAFQTVKSRWWIAYVNYYESHYPHRSYNKAITDEFSMLENSNDLVDLKSLNCNHTNIIKNDSVNDDIINVDIINDIIINNINSNNNNNSINNNVNNNNSISQPSFLEWLRYMLLIKIFSAPKNSSRIISFKLLSPINSFSGNKPNIPSSLFGKDDPKQEIILDSQNDQDIYLVPPESVHSKDSSQHSSLDLLSHCLNPSTSSDPLIDSNNETNQTNTNNTNDTSNICISFNSIPKITNYMVGDDGRIDIVLGNSEPTDIDLSKKIEMCKLMLKML